MWPRGPVLLRLAHLYQVVHERPVVPHVRVPVLLEERVEVGLIGLGDVHPDGDALLEHFLLILVAAPALLHDLLDERLLAVPGAAGRLLEAGEVEGGAFNGGDVVFFVHTSSSSGFS